MLRTMRLAPFRMVRAARAAPLVALAALLVLPAVAQADIYTFTDADGVVHFTNTPHGDKRYRVFIKGNGGWSKPGSGPAPGVVPVPPSDHDIARYTRYSEWIRQAAT